MAPARAAADQPLRLAYADPPYPGLARRYYGEHPDFAGEVDHRALLEQLDAYDGWALSTSAAALPFVLSLVDERRAASKYSRDAARAAARDVRVAAWVKGARGHRNAYGPRSAWEPVVYAGGRRVGGEQPPDAIVRGSRAAIGHPDHVIGAKPAEVLYWIFDLLGARPGDELVDLFPGSGGVGRAWDVFASRGAGETRRHASRAAAADGFDEATLAGPGR